MRFFPRHLDVRDKPRHEHEIDRPLTEHLIRHVDITALRVPRLRHPAHAHSLPFFAMRTCLEIRCAYCLLRRLVASAERRMCSAIGADKNRRANHHIDEKLERASS
jgi:hypothetical protein